MRLAFTSAGAQKGKGRYICIRIRKDEIIHFLSVKCVAPLFRDMLLVKV